ncbi:hypothetical protein DL96DRAFT_234608 [Flagelloscypha sp. PMI_526]|nr:hypothetical protein DL96DRAFT_234608 [Flagelloscypha sp. PMI_526]
MISYPLTSQCVMADRVRISSLIHGPITLLPLEILHEIMVHTWTEYGLSMTSTSYDPDDAHTLCALPAVCMSHVCRTWYAAARVNGRIWSRIFIDDRGVESAEKTRRYLRMYLRRSSNYPLHIHLYGRTVWKQIFVDRLLPLLLKHKDRWIEIDCPRAFLHLNAWRRGGVYSMLETIRVQDSGSGDPALSDVPHPAFPTTPALRRIIAEDRVLVFLLRLGQAQWENLTSFSGALQAWDQDTKVIQLFRNITHLTLKCYTTFSVRTPFVLPNARDVDLSFPCHADVMVHLLSTLVFPSLQALTIRGGWHGSVATQHFRRCLRTVLGNLLVASHRAVTHLSLDDFPLNTEDLVEILTLIPDLISLHLGSVGPTLPLLECLYSSKHDTQILPKLNEMGIGGDYDNQQCAALVKMCERRQKVLRTLIVPVYCAKDVDDDDWDDMVDTLLRMDVRVLVE